MPLSTPVAPPAEPGVPVRRGVVVAAAAAAAVLLTGAQGGCQSRADSGVASGDTALAVAEGPRVTYVVSADAPISSVSYVDSEGAVSTDTNVGDGWTGSARMPTSATEAKISAVPGPGTTTIRCDISSGGAVIVSASSVGNPPARVSCGGVVTPVDTSGETTPSETSTGPVVETDIVGSGG